MKRKRIIIIIQFYPTDWLPLLRTFPLSIARFRFGTPSNTSSRRFYRTLANLMDAALIWWHEWGDGYSLNGSIRTTIKSHRTRTLLCNHHQLDHLPPGRSVFILLSLLPFLSLFLFLFLGFWRCSGSLFVDGYGIRMVAAGDGSPSSCTLTWSHSSMINWCFWNVNGKSFKLFCRSRLGVLCLLDCFCNKHPSEAEIWCSLMFW